jgi:multidrug resistance efflux pump
MNRIMWPLGILLLVGMVVGAGWALNQAHPQPGPNGDAPVGSDALREVFCLGIVDVEDGVADLYPKQAGQVAEIAATRVRDKDGTERERVFKKGELLLRLHSEMADFQLSKARAALRAAEAELEAAKKLPEMQKIKLKIQQSVIAGHEHKKKQLEADLDRKKRALKENVGDVNKEVLAAMQEGLAAVESEIQAEREKAELLKLDDPELHIRRAQAHVDAKRNDVKTAEQAVKDFRLVAPFDGTALRVLTHVGEMVVPSPKAPAIEFCPAVPRVVRAEVVQEWGQRVQVGQEAEVHDDVYNGPVWRGRVKSLSPWYAKKRMTIIEPFMTNDVRTLECIVEFTGPPPPVRIGQRVRVKIKV